MATLAQLVKENPDVQVLVCAPSNSAVDLLCERAALVFQDESGRSPIVRVGNSEKVSKSTEKYLLSNLVPGDNKTLAT